MTFPMLFDQRPKRGRVTKRRTQHRGRFLSPAIITALIALASALVITIAPRPTQTVTAQAGSGVETLPSLIVLELDDSEVHGYNVNGEHIRTEPFDDTITFHPTALKVDYVKGGNDGGVADASVIAADAASGFVVVSDEMLPLTDHGILFDIDFDAGDRLFTANLSRSNDGCDSKLFPECALDEIVVAHRSLFGAFTIVEVIQLQANDSSHESIESFAIPGALPEDIAVGDVAPEALGRDGFDAFGGDGLAEIIVANPGTGSGHAYDSDGELIDSGFIDLRFQPGDQIVTGDVNGVGGEEIVVAHTGLGTVDVFGVDVGFEVNKDFTINASFGPDDQIDLVDIDGNGAAEILVAQAETGNVDVFRYDVIARTMLTASPLPVPYSAGTVFAALPIRYPDLDGDGLFDHWETNGVDFDGDGSVDIDLPSMGADPNHKDLFVEYDYVEDEEPTRIAVELVIQAFANAPPGAGTRPNPDGTPGINLWFDTGGLVDTATGLPVGVDLGGGELIGADEVPAVGICGLDTDYKAIKEAHFDPMRTFVFRYGLSIADYGDIDGDGIDDCRDSGVAELSGNDFVEHENVAEEGVEVIEEAQVIMHELGHTLGLLHGGFETHNCKPNYISIMNYNYTSGIYRQDGSTIIDYSPARVIDKSAAAPLPDLTESALDENVVLDPTDNRNFVTFSSPSGVAFNRPANDQIDWNDENGIEDGTVNANIDSAQFLEDCINDQISSEPMKGHNDWANIILRVHNSVDAAAGAVVPSPIDEPSTMQIIALKRDLNTADLVISQVAEPIPAVADAELTYTLTITNNGPNPVSNVQVIDRLHTGVTYQGSNADCNTADSEVTCNLPIVKVDEPIEVSITVLVDSELGLNEPGPALITNTARVSDPGEVAVDPNPVNNTSTLETEVHIQADLELLSFQPSSTPVELVVGQSALIDFETVVTNHGPFGPVTAVFDVVEPTSGAIIAGASSLVRAEDLAAGEERTLQGTVILTCAEPGVHDVAVVKSVGLREAEAVDLDLSNNQAAAEISVECLLPVAINIKPGSETNPVNLNSQVPVALLKTTAGQYTIPVDIRPSLIDPASIQFGARDVLLGVADPQGAAPRHDDGHSEDALELDERTRDGDQDLILHFKAAESGLEAGDVEACLRATITVNRTDTLEVLGCDAVTIRP